MILPRNVYANIVKTDNADILNYNVRRDFTEIETDVSLI